MTDGSPGAKPLRADARRNRAAIVDAADAAFASDGIAVGMDDIARAAGVGVGTLYRHFPTKEALFAAVLHHHVELLVVEAGRLAHGPDAGAAFFTFARRLLGEASVKRNLIEALSASGIEPMSEADPLKERMTAAMTVLLEGAQGAGAVRGDVTAAEVMSLLMGTCMALSRSPADPGTTSRLAEIVCDGLRPPPGAPVQGRTARTPASRRRGGSG